MEEDQILDADFEDPNLKLSNFQLIGIITEKVRYPADLISKVDSEINKRKISMEEIRVLKDRYQKNDKVDQWEIPYQSFSMISVFLLLLLSSLPFFFVGPSILFISIFAIKTKVEKGILAERRIWSFFKLTYFCLFILALIISRIIL